MTHHLDASPLIGSPPESDLEDLYEHAPCGYLSTLVTGEIVKVNATLLTFLGYSRDELIGRRRFTDLLRVGSRIYYETHYLPLLQMQGTVGGMAMDLRAADGSRFPALLASVVKPAEPGSDRPALVRTTVFDAHDRRAYEHELLTARQHAEQARAEADQARAEAERARADANRERESVQRLASTLQRSLLPPTLPTVPGMDVASYYHVASPDEVGGDFYDLFPIGNNQWGLFLGDVCGKGAVAAAVTSLARYTARAAAVNDPDPIAVLNVLNTVLNHEYHGDDPRFCTIIFGLLTPGTGTATVTLASGGHPAALLLRADGTTTAQTTPGGQLVGALPDAHFAAVTFIMARGDTLLLFTDGLTEARIGNTRTRYDEEALLAHVAPQAPTTAPALMTNLRELLASFGDGLDDDAALLALSIPAAHSPTAHIPAAHSPAAGPPGSDHG
ncbi:SpoIIE family protein phosphatase [Pseudonocardia sp. GCM10023141]|uniref:SpoIIE family protein phosphatase n=1 Tax=Pseudonocardia sp. GCM10023141 TaxID=3252653 RepID=UPI003612493C